MELANLNITFVNKELVDVEYKDDEFPCNWWKEDREELIKKMHNEIDGKRTDLWSDNDPEERSDRAYLCVTSAGDYLLADCLTSLAYRTKERFDAFYCIEVDDGLL